MGWGYHSGSNTIKNTYLALFTSFSYSDESTLNSQGHNVVVCIIDNEYYNDGTKQINKVTLEYVQQNATLIAFKEN